MSKILTIPQRKLACAKAIKAFLSTECRHVYNNIYYTGTRTIKVYNRFDQDRIPQIKDQITDLANMFDLDVKFNLTKAGHWLPCGSFIVKL
jgi:hypothetical protein